MGWSSSRGDNLCDHTATENLVMDTWSITFSAAGQTIQSDGFGIDILVPTSDKFAVKVNSVVQFDVSSTEVDINDNNLIKINDLASGGDDSTAELWFDNSASIMIINGTTPVLRLDSGTNILQFLTNDTSGGSIAYGGGDLNIGVDSGKDIVIDADTITLSGAVSNKITNTPLEHYNRTDANRGAAGTPGRTIFNTDDGQLNIDNGSAWTLPDGTTT